MEKSNEFLNHQGNIGNLSTLTESNPGHTIAYLNGQFLPLSEAKVSPLDRGFTYGDGLYEVLSVDRGNIFQLASHIERLNEGLQAIGLAWSLPLEEWQSILETLLLRNNAGTDNTAADGNIRDQKQEKVTAQVLYIQITRGPQLVRDIRCAEQPSPTLFIACYPKRLPTKQEVSAGLKAIAVTDIRWKHCDIKTTSRLAYVLMHQEAVLAGCDEAIVLQNGIVLEGTTSNVFIVRHGVIITPLKNHQILSGITRTVILGLAEKHRLPYRETKVTERDLSKADEIWIVSATRGVYPVIELNQTPVGKGKAGPIWETMFDLYWTYLRADADAAAKLTA